MVEVGERDGIYFGLDAKSYHEDTALGSNDHKRLLTSPMSFWWQSKYNPARPKQDDDSPALIFGRAIHFCIERGAVEFTKSYGPKTTSWATIEGRAEKRRFEAAGKISLSHDDYERILAASTIIRSRPSLSEAFTGGENEVSIFWTADGIRLKSRIDYLKSRALIDLKSIRNTRDLEFKAACRNSIAQFHYDIQASHYLEARSVMPSLYEEGLVHGPHDDEWLKKVVYAKEAAFVIVFYQATEAPLTWSCKLSPGNELLQIARHKLLKARDIYRENRDKFGTEAAWIADEPIEELDLSEMPGWFMTQM